MKQFWLTAVILCTSLPCYATIELGQLYGLREKDVLQEFVQHAENEMGVGPADLQKLKMLGIAYHNLATLKVKDASRKAMTYLQKALSLSMNDDEIQVYLGSATTMVGRDSWNVLAKLSNVKKGIKIMDEAVAKMPTSIVVRMVRANNSLDLPDLFKRKEIAKKDFHDLEALITKPSVDVGSDIKAEIFYQLGMISIRETNVSEAKAYFRKSINASPASQWGKESERNLKP